MKILLDQTIPLPGEADTRLRVLVGDVTDLLKDEIQAASLPLLSPQRRAKAEAYKFPRGRTLCIGVSRLLDMLLQDVGLREKNMQYVEGEHGKPRFTDTVVGTGDFSLSHSGHLAAAALINRPSAYRVGIDVQHVTRYKPEIVRRVFTPEECAAMAACTSEAAREALFTERWCRAEAFAKATGRGLQLPAQVPGSEAQFMMLQTGEPDYAGCICLLPANH